jgi:hypothetical protein
VDGFFQSAAANFLGELAAAIVVAIATGLLVRLRKKSRLSPRGLIPHAKSWILRELSVMRIAFKKI